MTFDEALEELHPRTIWSPEMRDLLEQLRATYAPEIEMTQSQKNVFELAKHTLKTSNLANVVKGQGPAYSILDELSGRVWGHNQGEASEAQIEKTMHAWLHPELVKVVD